MNVLIRTAAQDFRSFFATPPAPTAYVALGPTKTSPKGTDGIIPLAHGGDTYANFGKFVFWGTGNNGDSFSVKIVGWQLHADGEWWRITLADILCTLGSRTRAVSSDKVVKTIAINGGLVVANYEIIPADTTNLVQMLKLDLQGCQYLQLLPGTQTGSVTAINGGMSGY